MSVPVPFGTYAPGESFVHRLEPRAKLGVAAAYIILVFAVDGWIGLLVAGSLAAWAIAVSRVPARLVSRGLRPVLFVLVLTVVANALALSTATDELLRAGPVVVSASGLVRGLFFATRIVLLVVGTSLMTLTTSPVQLTDAISRLLSPLERLGFPATDVATMFAVALRFIPTTAQEAERIVVAQTARGARFDQGGPIARGRAYVPVLVPLFVGLFRRADDLAIAMEARCYRGHGRTRLNERRLRVPDTVTLVVAAAVAAAGVVYL